MTRVPDEATLHALLAFFQAHNPEYWDLVTASTESEFVAATDRALNRVIRRMEEGATHYGQWDEPALSHLLCDLLAERGFHAAPEQDQNGHVDVLIEHVRPERFRYPGECKVWDGYVYHIAGCRQVLGYCTGREQRAFVLEFVKKPGMYEKLRALRAQMDEEQPGAIAQVRGSTDHASIRGAFVTEHEHRSGRTLEILHLGCSLVTAAGGREDVAGGTAEPDAAIGGGG